MRCSLRLFGWSRIRDLSSENVTAETKIQNDPSTKADKLEASNTNEPGPEVKSVKSVSIVSPTTEPPQSPASSFTTGSNLVVDGAISNRVNF
jgi:hypothetical protein